MCKYMMPVLALLFLALNPVMAAAQVVISADGNIAVGDVSPNSSRQLNVECTECTGSNKAGVYSIVTGGSGFGRGVHGIGLNAYQSVGVHGEAANGYTNYGVWGSASGGFGGYFTGGLYVSGGITQPSDERLKTNIRELNRQNAWDGIRQLRPLRYEFLSEEELRQRGMPASHYAEGEHLGLSAQDVEAVFPELVKDVTHSLDTEIGQEDSPGGIVVTKGVNYQGLVTALIATVQELQARIEALEAALEDK
jgi:outer membrane murein-binding lipoprotein Lpp